MEENVRLVSDLPTAGQCPARIYEADFSFVLVGPALAHGRGTCCAKSLGREQARLPTPESTNDGCWGDGRAVSLNTHYIQPGRYSFVMN
jgi:hypothetical protein